MLKITASQVKDLRDATNVSMMECKRALQETDGDVQNAMRLLRERGIAIAAKKAGRTANNGLIASATIKNGAIASLIEVKCETDFVARNTDFIAFVQGLALIACNSDVSLADQVKREVTEKIAEVGENIVVTRNTRFVIESTGRLESYIHRGKVGVLLELGYERNKTLGEVEFQTLSRDLALHITASNPLCISPNELPKEDLISEREIYAKQVQDKPDQIAKKIIDGKIKKFYEQTCLLNQAFVKEPKESISDLLEKTNKVLDDTISIRRFTQYQLGE